MSGPTTSHPWRAQAPPLADPGSHPAAARPPVTALWPGLQPRSRPAPLSDLWLVGTPPTGALIGALLHLCGPGLLLALVGAAAAAWADVAFTHRRWPIRTTTPHHPPRAGAR